MKRRYRLVRRPFSIAAGSLRGQPRISRHGFTLIEMLIAMAITLIMIGAVVTLFANLSNSVRNRRAVVEISGQLRHARNVLQRDLQGATCPGLTWQRPDDNLGYIEIIEGPAREGNASSLVDGVPENGEIDTATSILPSSNVPKTGTAVTDGAGLGDFDDILMLTVRNEHEPFVGRSPANVRLNLNNAEPFDVNSVTAAWSTETIESPQAEVVWYSVENPSDGNTTTNPNQDPDNFFGEPGLRTIYRRALLIAPWINPYRFVDNNGNHDTFDYDSDSFQAKPGLVRILPRTIGETQVDLAVAALIAFQERYDLSVRLEWDPLLGASNPGRWKIVANTLGDLTKRENRYEHHFVGRPLGSSNPVRRYPFAVVSSGRDYPSATANVTVLQDPEIASISFAGAQANVFGGSVRDYTIQPDNLTNAGRRLSVRPLAYVNEESPAWATARAMLNGDGRVVRVIHGLVPLSGDRRGEDVMLTDALGFDLHVYDPGAPLFQHVDTDTVIDPTDPAWLGYPQPLSSDVVGAYMSDDNMEPDGTGTINSANYGTNTKFRFVGQGAYVDLGYGFDPRADRFSSPRPTPIPMPRYGGAFANSIDPWFFQARAISDVYGDDLAPGYSVYDTWSFHFENNGVNEDQDEIDGNSGNWRLVDNDPPAAEDDRPQIDEATNGLDDPGHYSDGTFTRLGPDDVGERETRPPYDRPLRGAQAVIRLYERDSRQIKQVTVSQNFVPE